MLCCKELTTPLNKASMVVPVGENGSWFISSKFLVQEAKAIVAAQMMRIYLFMMFRFYRFTFSVTINDRVPG